MRAGGIRGIRRAKEPAHCDADRINSAWEGVLPVLSYRVRALRREEVVPPSLITPSSQDATLKDIQRVARQ